MDQPLFIEIIAYAPTAYYHCMHCEVAWREMGVSNHVHQEQVSNSLPSDLAQEYQEISDWVADLFRRYCDQVVVKVIDAASLEGFVKSIRYSIHRFPAIIIDHKARFTGNALQPAHDEIDRLFREDQKALP